MLLLRAEHHRAAQHAARPKILERISQLLIWQRTFDEFTDA